MREIRKKAKRIRERERKIDKQLEKEKGREIKRKRNVTN